MEKTLKRDKIIVWIILSIIVFGMIGAIAYRFIYDESGGKRIIKESAALNFSGRVNSIYRDERNHNVKTVVLNDGYKYGVYAEWESSIEVGDSLSKVGGTLDLIVFKKDKQKVILNYMELAKSRKWKL